MSTNGRWKDATNIEYTSSTWPTTEAGQSVTFTGTVFRVVTNSANTNVISHVRVVSAGSGTPVGADAMYHYREHVMRAA